MIRLIFYGVIFIVLLVVFLGLLFGAVIGAYSEYSEPRYDECLRKYNIIKKGRDNND